MSAFPAPWFVAGGWALDLSLGRVSRLHEDVEVALFRDDQRALRGHLAGWEFEKVAEGRRAPWGQDEWLAAPVHEVHGRRIKTQEWMMEFLLEERDDGHWVYRRNVVIKRPVAEIGARAFGVPYLRPEIVLLYKARSPRPIDEQDFSVAAGSLDVEGRAWLAQALQMCHPGHRWLDVLKTMGSHSS